MKKNLKKILNSKKTFYFMEAHNGISAKLVEQNNFDGIWASGLTISASMGLRDVNEMSWSQVCDILNYITLSSDLPVILDADTGYGSFNNTIHLARHLDRIGVEGMCIEDKIFPKKNSFYLGNKQPLEDIETFSGKIKSVKDSFPNIQVIARVESLIAGWGIEEAFKRADAYRSAGADAILIHSKKKDISEIDEFIKNWDKDFPIVLVPTTYYKTKPEYFENKKISVVIWANHLLRSSITSMQKTLHTIKREKSLKKIENNIFPVKEIFEITEMNELSNKEKKYLPQIKNINAIILAATQGVEFGVLTRKIPKSLLKINKKPLLDYQINILNKSGIKDISIVSGFKNNLYRFHNTKIFINKNWKKTSNLQSLWEAKNELKDTIISFGDIIYSEKAIQVLNYANQEKEDIVILCDKSWLNHTSYRKHYIGVKCNDSKNRNIFSNDSVRVLKLQANLNKENSDGEFIGMLRLSEKGSQIFKKYLKLLKKSNNLEKMSLDTFINYLIKNKQKVFAKYIDGGWLDVDNDDQLKYANKIIND
jgi:phosphoenolpyruvate phosphomutase